MAEQPTLRSEVLATLAEAGGLPLARFAETTRFASIDRQEAYYRCAQDDAKMYDWDGHMLGYGGEADIAPGWFVPYKRRRPSSRYDLAKVIVNRLTSMLFGSDRFPELRVEGDPEAEDFVKALCEVSRLPMRMAEARSLGGACGSVCLSWGFVEGKPRVEVHNAKHVTVLRWADRSEWRVGAALLTYSVPRQVIEKGKIVTKDFFYARYWDERGEIVWDLMPREVAQSTSWTAWKRRAVTHDFGFTPFYWVQNIPDSTEPDGECDYEGLQDTLDAMNRLLSATTRGTVSNVDPTLVLKMDPSYNDGVIKRGTDNTIWSPNGAEYLELRGGSTQTALQLLDKLRSYVLDSASVVLADPEKLSGAAQSAQALRILYAPMLAKCDVLREQYTEFAVKPLLRDMLRAAKGVLAKAPTPAVTKEGTPVEVIDTVVLPAKAVREGDDVRLEPRVPGQSEELVCNWNPYFAPTWNDIKAATEAVKLANGGKPVITQRTSVAAVQTLFGVVDVDQEVEGIREQSERDVEMAQRAMQESGPRPEMEGEDGEDEEDDHAEPEESAGKAEREEKREERGE